MNCTKASVGATCFRRCRPALRARAAVNGILTSSSTTSAPQLRAHSADPSVEPESTYMTTAAAVREPKHFLRRSPSLRPIAITPNSISAGCPFAEMRGRRYPEDRCCVLHGRGCSGSVASPQDVFAHHKHVSQDPKKNSGNGTHDPIVFAEIQKLALDVQC